MNVTVEDSGISGNDASTPKSYLTLGSSFDEGFVGGTTAVAFAVAAVWISDPWPWNRKLVQWIIATERLSSLWYL